MGRILYLDCENGISGDMLLGALLGLGIDKAWFISELSKIEMGEYHIEVEEYLHKHGVANDVKVLMKKCTVKRNMFSIFDLINNSGISSNAKILSKKIFKELAAAESRVHGLPLSDVLFHEIGAVDSIVDIVGVSILIDAIGADAICSSELHDGCGTIKCRCGVIPVPVPAVMAMVDNTYIPLIIHEEVTTEMITPTGMSVIKTISASYGPIPQLDILQVGYGKGDRETGRTPLLRATLGNDN